MFESLSDRLNKVFTELRRHGRLSEADVERAMRDVRLALLEADVHYGVVKTFIDQGDALDKMVGRTSVAVRCMRTFIPSPRPPSDRSRRRALRTHIEWQSVMSQAAPPP